MLVTRIAVILLFISAATCSSINAFYRDIPSPALPGTIPLSAPLPNGTMEIQVNCSVTMEVQLKIGANTGEVTMSLGP
ncbi:hypothetical protein JB92DRAFT_2946178 [Gautieria morchelliformis]|nr:hypothetical protein JB92DRAFT_2946178 [Gautieria morchelliformis]